MNKPGYCDGYNEISADVVEALRKNPNLSYVCSECKTVHTKQTLIKRNEK